MFHASCRSLAGLVLALGVATGALAAPAFEGPKALPAAEGVWYFQGAAALGTPANRNFISNAGFVVTPDGVVVVDALGSPALAQAALAEIRRITPLPVRYVVVTHYHADHIYGLQVYQAAGARIVGHGAAREYLNSESAQLRLQASRSELAPWVDADTRLVPADRWVGSGDTVLTLGGEDIVLRPVGPAHTPEDLVVWLPRRGVMFSGDLFFRGRIPFVGQADSRRWIASLDRLIEVRPSLVVPGHGPLSREPMADLVLTRDYLRHLRRSMGAAARNLEPFDEAYARTDWSRFEALPLFKAANRMNAYNTYLLMEQAGGEASSEDADK
ncbi:MAG: MBL fold metallo-hydrolase [Rubrivivax sp.]|nr:MBL fold metallo-hydrolase [Rubrivivax sp.]